jgi:uncharacterized ferredoxin-like protein
VPRPTDLAEPAPCISKLHEFTAMAEFIGKDGIHNISGACELCGAVCDPSTEELNCLSCTFQQCDAGLYHQDCLEKFLKRTGCEKYGSLGFLVASQ